MRNEPTLRFLGFAKEYNKQRLGKIMFRVSKNNKDEEFGINDILSLSSTQGIVDRKSISGDTYSKVNHLNYTKTKLNDFVYGKSISSRYPYGLFKANRCRDGLLSTLYFTFDTYEHVNSAYLDKYFSYNNRTNNFLKKYVLVGDRYITADANYILSGEISIPGLDEQDKIVDFFDNIDLKISKLEEKLRNLKLFKKGFANYMFEILDGNETAIKKLILKNTNFNNCNKTKYLEISGIDIKTKMYYLSAKLPVKGAKKAESGAILVSTVRPSRGAITRLEENIMISSALVPLYADTSKVDSEFLFQSINRPKFFDRMEKLSTGGTYPTISKEDVISCKITLPNLKQQKRLGYKLQVVDNKIRFMNLKLEALKQFTSSLYSTMSYNVFILILEASI